MPLRKILSRVGGLVGMTVFGLFVILNMPDPGSAAIGAFCGIGYYYAYSLVCELPYDGDTHSFIREDPSVFRDLLGRWEQETVSYWGSSESQQGTGGSATSATTDTTPKRLT